MQICVLPTSWSIPSWHCKVSEFGKSHREGNVANSHCCEATDKHHVAPEVQAGGEVSMKSDAFSFGVMLMELITVLPPRKALSLAQGSGPHDVRVRDLMGKVEALLGESVPHMREYLDLAVRCTAMAPFSRPNFEAIVGELKTLLYDTAKTRETQTSRPGSSSKEGQSSVVATKNGGKGEPNESSTSILGGVRDAFSFPGCWLTHYCCPDVWARQYSGRTIAQ
eukprot:jgi/Botrbrau1/22159/Bobra.0206s0082.1